VFDYYASKMLCYFDIAGFSLSFLGLFHCYCYLHSLVYLKENSLNAIGVAMFLSLGECYLIRYISFENYYWYSKLDVRGFELIMKLDHLLIFEDEYPLIRYC